MAETAPPTETHELPDAPALHPVLADRRSTRAFLPDPLSGEEVRTLLEAARWAPSAFNEQPWRIHYATPADPEGHAALGSLLFEGNAWARRAPFLAVVTARTRYAVAGHVPHGDENPWAFYDTGAAALSLTLQATALGLATHQMGGFDRDAARRVLGLPDDEEPVAVVAVARPGPVDALPEKLQRREDAPRTRRPLGEVARPVRAPASL